MSDDNALRLYYQILELARNVRRISQSARWMVRFWSFCFSSTGTLIRLFVPRPSVFSKPNGRLPDRAKGACWRIFVANVITEICVRGRYELFQSRHRLSVLNINAER
jgi:hypothetical protein